MGSHPRLWITVAVQPRSGSRNVVGSEMTMEFILFVDQVDVRSLSSSVV